MDCLLIAESSQKHPALVGSDWLTVEAGAAWRAGMGRVTCRNISSTQNMRGEWTSEARRPAVGSTDTEPRQCGWAANILIVTYKVYGQAVCRREWPINL